MARGPEDLRGPNSTDLEFVDSLEKAIDTSREFREFVHGTVRVPINPVWFSRFFAERAQIRQNEFIRRYKNAGWFSVVFKEDEIVFSEI